MRGAEGEALLDAFNVLPLARARDELLAVCASPVWAQAVAAARPYRSGETLLATADAAFAALTWSDLAEALAAHPRIGDRPEGDGRDAAWSRREQAGVAASVVAGSAEALAEANRAYERRFGHVFLIFASGRIAPEILAAARERLGNDDQTERAVVRAELAKIVRLRLERLLET
jgi:2-oxo-4-hydroxy-4-carboxy-5-ureidoimidazoline decarboxylase